MKLSTLLLLATQTAIALSSAHIASPSPDDEHGVLSATPEDTNNLVARACWNGTKMNPIPLKPLPFLTGVPSSVSITPGWHETERTTDLRSVRSSGRKGDVGFGDDGFGIADYGFGFGWCTD
ncbi:MAG: hypothetical protein LQ339_007030 [Xanthoria mediterranea]|nr:MAG: hypothetical protein LQ339_007030 [Xanthoria mediterranea]